MRIALFVSALLLLLTPPAAAIDGRQVPRLSVETCRTVATARAFASLGISIDIDQRVSADCAELRRKIGQMMIIGLPGTSPGDDWPRRAAQMIKESQIGGVLIFAQNVRNPAQVRTLTYSFRRSGSELPPFVAIDQEGGKIQRLTRQKGFVALPSAERMARMPVPAVHPLYRRTADELASLGFNLNLGPVVDLNLNPRNPAIGGRDRSYGTDPRIVFAYAREFIAAHRTAGVLTAIKHFPGHGSAIADTHAGVANISGTWSKAELEPFRDLIDQGLADMIMIGHLVHPRFSQGDLPASLSERAIQTYLRQVLGFDGLVITDDLDMQAVRDRFTIEQAAVMAIEAGADLLIIANDRNPDIAVVDRVTDAVLAAVDGGSLSRDRIETSYERIVAVKQKLGGRKTAARN